MLSVTEHPCVQVAVKAQHLSEGHLDLGPLTFQVLKQVRYTCNVEVWQLPGSCSWLRRMQLCCLLHHICKAVAI